MKFKSLILTEARGSAGGATFSQNKAGAFIRAKVKGTNPKTAKQTAQRAQFSAITSSWKALTEGQRQSWIDAAADFPYQDALGQTKYYSGAQLYNALNGGIRSANPSASLLTVAPSSVSLPPVTLTGFEAMTDATTMEIGGGFAPASVPDNCVLKVYVTNGLSAGVYAAPRSSYYLLLTIAAGAIIMDALDIAFGSIQGFAVGKKMFIRGVLISTTTGQQSVVFVQSAVAGAL